MEEWKDYFIRKLLGEVKGKVIKEEAGITRKRETEVKINREEIRRAIKKLRDRKAASIDEILNEMWKYRGKGLMEWA